MSTDNVNTRTQEDTVSDPKPTDCDDVKITPEMIEAGEDALLEHGTDWCDSAEVVADVYSAMAKAGNFAYAAFPDARPKMKFR